MYLHMRSCCLWSLQRIHSNLYSTISADAATDASTAVALDEYTKCVHSPVATSALPFAIVVPPSSRACSAGHVLRCRNIVTMVDYSPETGRPFTYVTNFWCVDAAAWLENAQAADARVLC